MAGVQYLLSLMPIEIIPGDVNGTGIVDIQDLADVIDVILGHPSPDIIMEAVDFNGDGLVDINDVTDMVYYILTGETESE